MGRGRTGERSGAVGSRHAARDIILLAVLAAAIVFLRRSGLGDHLTFESLKENSALLLAFVERHYLLAVAVYIGLFISTAFVVPGALVLTIAGGFLFGVMPGTLYTTLGASAGASLSFFAARYLAGKRIQRHYRTQLERFNAEIDRNGYIYLFIMRVVPVFPFFVVNVLAGLTRIPYRVFLVMTLLGMIPGAAVYSFVGRQLSTVHTADDLLSPGIIAALVLLALFTLAPILYRHRRRARR